MRPPSPRGLGLIALISLLPGLTWAEEPLPTHAAMSPLAEVVEEANAGRIGLSFQRMAEGLLVTSVSPGNAAAKAGLPVGAIITSIDGQAVAAGADRAQILGEPGTTVRLTYLPPLGVAGGGAESSLDIVREVIPPKEAPERNLHPAVRDFREAMRSGRKGPSLKATRALIAEDFGGQTMSSAVGAGLLVARQKNPHVAALVAAELYAARPEQAAALGGIIGCLLDGGLTEQAIAAGRTRSSSLPPDVRLADGRAGDFGADAHERKQFVEALLQQGDREGATEALRSLAGSVPVGELERKLGMAPQRLGDEWRAQLPPITDLRLPLLAGGTFDVEALRGKTVVLAFWATWCGPCQEELPELDQLAKKLAPEGVQFIAISLDEASISEDALQASVAKLGLSLPVAHAPNLGARFKISGLPSVRVLGRDGALHYSAQGYSKEGMARLEGALALIKEEPIEKGVRLGTPWGPGTAKLIGFSPLPGARSLSVGSRGVAVGVEQGAPALLGLSLEAAVDPDVGARTGLKSEKMAWVAGPIVGDPGLPLLRAWDLDGALRFVRGLPGPLVALTGEGETIWVALTEELLVLNAAGELLARRRIGLRDLSPADDETGGVFGVVAGGRRRFLLRDGAIVESEAADMEGAGLVAGGGEVAVGGAAAGIVSGRFGPQGARRVLVARRDGTLIGLDGQGRPAFAISLQEPGAMAAVDPDGDGRDELYVVLPRFGVARVSVELP